jgi:hypothetical protein
LLPYEQVTFITPLSCEDVAKIASSGQNYQSDMLGRVIRSAPVEEIEFELRGLRRLWLPRLIFRGSVRKESDGVQLEGRIFPAHSWTFKLWWILYCSVFGASLFLWSLDFLVGSKGLQATILAFAKLVGTFGAIGVIVAIWNQTQFASLRSEREALCSAIQSAIKAREEKE